MTTRVIPAAVQAYRDALPPDSDTLTIEKVEWGEFDEAIWIVTTVRAKGGFKALHPLYDAEVAAHRTSYETKGPGLVFHVIDLDIGEQFDFGPRTLTLAEI